MFRLGETLGKQSAHHVLHKVLMRAAEDHRSFREALLSAPELEGKLTEADFADMTDPAAYIGTAQAQVDAVIAESRRLRAQDPQ